MAPRECAIARGEHTSVFRFGAQALYSELHLENTAIKKWYEAAARHVARCKARILDTLARVHDSRTLHALANLR